MADLALPAIYQDFDWDTYNKQANSYLSRPIFGGTPIKSEMLANSAGSAWNKYGITIPVELALAQAQMESSMGKKGRNPTTNPYNVYEYDAGTKKKYTYIEDSIKDYYDLMARNYLSKKNMNDLLNNFVNNQGKRYASNPNYEKTMKQQVKYIQNYLKKQQLFGGEPLQ